MRNKTVDETLQQHYASIAEKYDQYWQYSTAFVDWMRRQIQSRLAVTPRHRVVDLGGGTGLYTAALARALRPENPVLCVDKSEPMLTRVPSQVNVEARLSDITAFARGGERFDRAYMKEVIHHIEDKKALFDYLFDALPPDGVFVIALLPPKIDYPLFQAALERYEALQPDYHTIERMLTESGFATVSSQSSFNLSIEKQRYLDMVYNRYMSLLSMFSEEELIQGVAEIDQRFKGPSLEFTDRFVFITAVRI